MCTNEKWLRNYPFNYSGVEVQKSDSKMLHSNSFNIYIRAYEYLKTAQPLVVKVLDFNHLEKAQILQVKCYSSIIKSGLDYKNWREDMLT